MKKDHPVISVVVPCYNEEQVLPFYYSEMNQLMDQMKQVEFEIIFVDDGSSDDTLNTLKQLNKKDKRCKYIAFSRNFGKEAALYAGLDKTQGKYVVVMDADLQDPPPYIPQMYEILQTEDYDCVATYRSDRKGERAIRSLFSKMFYRVINRITQVQMKQGARDYRMMKRGMVDALLSLKEKNRFSKGMFEWVGFRTKWLEYHNVERVAGDTKWSFLKLTKYAIDGIIGFSTFPLTLVSWIGLVFCLIAFLMVIFLVIKNLIWHDPVAGWASMMCVMIFLGGIQMLCLGVLGQYMSRMYTEMKQRPLYILRETSEDNENDEDEV